MCDCGCRCRSGTSLSGAAEAAAAAAAAAAGPALDLLVGEVLDAETYPCIVILVEVEVGRVFRVAAEETVVGVEAETLDTTDDTSERSIFACSASRAGSDSVLLARSA